jgi:hypothetical protein
VNSGTAASVFGVFSSSATKFLQEETSGEIKRAFSSGAAACKEKLRAFK